MSNQQDQDQQQVKALTPKVKLARDPRVLTILEFIKSKDGTTMDKVAKYMNEKGICSRPTTRILLFSLLDEGIILEKQRRNTYFHDLVVNENYDFEGLLQDVFAFHAEDIKESLKPFQNLIPDKKIETKHYVDKTSKAVTELTLVTYMIEYKQRKDPFTHRQNLQFENRIDNKMIKKGMKHPKKKA